MGTWKWECSQLEQALHFVSSAHGPPGRRGGQELPGFRPSLALTLSMSERFGQLEVFFHLGPKGPESECLRALGNPILWPGLILKSHSG